MATRSFGKAQRAGLEDRSKLKFPGYKYRRFSEFGSFSWLFFITAWYYMIYRLFRRERTTHTPQLGKSMADESLFIEEIFRFVKLAKKKEMLYLRILEDNSLMKGSAEGESGWWKDF